MPSDPRPPAQPPRTRFDPPVQRSGVRITNLYGTAWEPVSRIDAAGLTGHLRFGRLAAYYDSAAAQLPVVAHQLMLDPSMITFDRWDNGRLVGARLWMLIMPSGQAVVAFSVDIDGSLLDAIDLLIA